VIINQIEANTIIKLTNNKLYTNKINKQEKAKNKINKYQPTKIN